MIERPNIADLGVGAMMTMEDPAFAGLLWKMTPASLAKRVSGGQWVAWPYLQLLSRKLMDVAVGRCKRLIVTMPPRHGKSEIVSKWFPLWFLENFPEKKVILCSYEMDFAAKWGGKVRDLISNNQDILTSKFKNKMPAMHSWELEEGGGMSCAGAGGPITGKGADLLIIDDPIKNPLCVETPVTFGDGSIHRLGDVVVGDVVVTHLGRVRKVSEIWERGNLQCVLIKTFSGRSLVVELSHPCLTLLDGWKLGSQVSVGDYLCLPRNYEFVRSARGRTVEEARLAGYLTGDGSCTNWIGLCVYDPEEKADAISCAELIGLGVRDCGNGTLHFKARENRLRDNAIQWTKRVELFGKRAHDKVVPGWVFSSDSNVAANFVGAYFATDGSVTSLEPYVKALSEKNNNKAGCKIQFDSVSKALLEGVRELLTRFGVYAHLRPAKVLYRGNYAHYWSLGVLGRTSCLNFARQIPVHHSEKRRKLAQWAEYFLEHAAQTSVEVLSDVKSGKVVDGISQNVLRNLRRGLTSGEKYSMVGKEYLYDRVVSIEPTEAACRCISVDEDSSFLANGLVVHNSEDAESLNMREKLWEWWLSTARTRIDPGGGVVVMMTRWNSDDLIGRLINPDSYPEKGLKDEWEVYNFPALAEPDADTHYAQFGVKVNDLRLESLANPLEKKKFEGTDEWRDILGRKRGKALCPDRYNEEDLAKIRGGSSEKFWFAMYQQRPGDEAEQGNVYHCFSELVHMRETSYNSSWRLFISLDFNVDPMCAVVGQYDPGAGIREMERCEILEEIILPESNTYAMCETLKMRLQKYRRGYTLNLEIFGDAAGNQRTANSRKTNWQIVAEHMALDTSLHTHFIRKKDNPNIADRINAVNGMLRSADGTVRLFVDYQKCPELVRDLMRVKWQTDSGGNSTGLLDKRDKKRTHVSDALGYTIEYKFGMKTRSGGRPGVLM